MPATKSVASTNNQDINGLLSSVAWAVNSFTFSFPTQGSFYEYGPEKNNNFAPLTATMMTAAREVLQWFSSVGNLTFTEITETASTHADLRYAKSDSPGTAYAYYPDSSPQGGDSWYRNTGGTYDNPLKGNYAFVTIAHETGHAMGLKHGHETDVYGALPTDHDSAEYSIMTYRSYVGSPGNFYTIAEGSGPQSLMQDDIAAIQYMYGANFSYNGGSTTYTWSPTTGEMLVNGVGQGASTANKIFVTVWDGGGNDTYNFFNYTTSLTVNLNPGAWTTTAAAQIADLNGNGILDAQDARGNIANALLYNGDLRSLIENAIGGSGNDSILGNQTDNALTGNGGSDRLDGGISTYTISWGADQFGTFTGDATNDILQLNPDGKAYVWSSTGSSFNTYNLWGSGLRPTDQVGDFNGDGKTDVIQLHENGNQYVWLSNGSGFSNYTVWGWGSRPDDKLGDFNGDGKTDVIELDQNGNQYVWLSNGSGFSNYTVWGWGSRPDDKLGDFNGDGKTDLIELDQNGNQYVWISNGSGFNNYTVWGWGTRPTDQIGDFNGDGKDDLIELHENGNAYVWLSTGNGFTNYSVWGIGVRPSDQIADFNGDGKDDIIQLHENGNAYVWISNGTSFNNYTIWGTGVLSGTSSGNDTLTGDGGNDTFVFKGVFGNDTVIDFTAGAGTNDVIEFDMFASFSAVLANTTDSGSDTVIHFGDNSVTIKNVLKASLHADDFSFV